MKAFFARLSLARLVVAITFLAIFAMSARVSADTDTWWHLRTGQWIVAHGAVPQTDPFSFTRAGIDWRIPGWIVQASLYLIFNAFGYAGLNLFTAALVTLTFALVYPACAGHPLLRAFALVLAAAASGIYWSARPQLVSLVLAAAFALILYRFRRQGQNQLWLLPPLMVLWANAHGGFAIGFILIALTMIGEGLKLAWDWLTKWRGSAAASIAAGDDAASAAPRPRRAALTPLIWLAGVGLVCGLAVMLNPAGPEMLAYPFKTVSIGVLRDFIQEWQSPDFHARETQPFLWLLLGTLAVVALARRPVDVTDLVLVCGLGYLGFLAGRNVPLLAVAAPPLLTRHAALLLEDAGQALNLRGTPAPERPALNWLLLLVIGAVVVLKVALVLPASVNEQALSKFLPLGAAAYIRREHPPGPMFNAYNFGAYLMWALYPDYPVYVDGRTDLYDDAFLRQYLTVAFGRPGYAEVLDRAGVRLALVEADSLIGDRLNDDPAWRVLYRDEVAAVYGRSK